MYTKYILFLHMYLSISWNYSVSLTDVPYVFEAIQLIERNDLYRWLSFERWLSKGHLFRINVKWKPWLLLKIYLFILS